MCRVLLIAAKMWICPKILIFVVPLITVVSSEWWSLGSSGSSRSLAKDPKVPCSEIRSLSRSQRTLCEKYRDHITYVSDGAHLGIEECQWQFRGERWNCSTSDEKRRNNDIRNNAVFGKVIEIGSRESAFTYAVSAAGVVYSVARACKEGKLGACGCSETPRPKRLGPEWQWGGCGDNTDYAYGFTREFIDARERDNYSPRNAKARSRKTMNLHNNEAGRMAVVRAARPTCKCHGVSGSCSLNTCWLQIPDFREVGNKLREKHNMATEVKVNRRGSMKPRKSQVTDPKINDLVYLDSSPDYCNPNPRTGVLGTKGRECTLDSDGMDGCGLMCCGRGHETFTVEVTYRCNCKFQWCCEVRCQKCRKRVRRHICR